MRNIKKKHLALRASTATVLAILLSLVAQSASGSWTQEAKLTAHDISAGERFGLAIAGTDDYVVVGAPDHLGPEGTHGAAYIFERAGADWDEAAKLTAKDPSFAQDFNDNFGWSLAIENDRIVVGAILGDLDECEVDRGYCDTGTAYIFERSGAEWKEVAQLTAPDAATGDWFGSDVALDDDRVVVGAFRAADGAGKAYVFERDDAGWVQTAQLTASDAAPGADFGISVAISGNQILIGSRGTDEKRGSAYVFQRTDTGWGEVAKLTASDHRPNDAFGDDVAIDGNRALVGGSQSDSQGPGVAYIFERVESTWKETAKLTASDRRLNDWFGGVVALSGDRAIIGAPGTDDFGENSGSVYVFDLQPPGWKETTKLTGSDTFDSDTFGSDVAIFGERAFVGALFDGIGGSAYVFSDLSISRADFNANGVLDAGDIDMLTPDVHDPSLDLTGDGVVTQEDRVFWVHELANTWFGDANLDGHFNSSDLVAVFEDGKYERDVVASWSEGDWNGDGRFGTGDLVTAFTDGGYKQGPQAALAVVPEPNGIGMITIALGLAAVSSTRRKSRRNSSEKSTTHPDYAFG